jgi:hypothetical protein
MFFRKELIYITLEPRKAYPWVFEREFTVIYLFKKKNAIKAKGTSLVTKLIYFLSNQKIICIP